MCNQVKRRSSSNGSGGGGSSTRTKGRQNEAKRNMSNLYSLRNSTISDIAKSEKRSGERTNVERVKTRHTVC